MDRHLLLKHNFTVAVSQRESTMDTAPTIPELKTPSTDAMVLVDLPMKDIPLQNTDKEMQMWLKQL